MGIVLTHAEGKSIHIYCDGNGGLGSEGRQVEAPECKQEGCKVKGLA